MTTKTQYTATFWNKSHVNSKKGINKTKTNLQKNDLSFQSLEGHSSLPIFCGIPIKPCSSSALLSTVTFYIQDFERQLQLCRRLLDCGAQSNLNTEDFCKLLNWKSPAKLSIIGINQVTSTLNRRTSITIFCLISVIFISI